MSGTYKNHVVSLCVFSRNLNKDFEKILYMWVLGPLSQDSKESYLKAFETNNHIM